MSRRNLEEEWGGYLANWCEWAALQRSDCRLQLQKNHFLSFTETVNFLQNAASAVIKDNVSCCLKCKSLRGSFHIEVRVSWSTSGEGSRTEIWTNDWFHSYTVTYICLEIWPCFLYTTPPPVFSRWLLMRNWNWRSHALGRLVSYFSHFLKRNL